jgi:hypothetical protein
VTAADLRAGDPTLGSDVPEGDVSKPAACGPVNELVADAGAGRALRVRFYGRRHAVDGVLLKLAATGAAVSGVTVELQRGGKVVARSARVHVGHSTLRVVLRRRARRRFPLGPYTLVVRRAGKVIARRAVRLGR